MRARIAAVAPLLALAALLWPDAASPAEPPPEPVEAHTAPAPPPEPSPPSVCDPDEYRRLRAGQGHPDNQSWHNQLRTDGADPDYMRYHVACDPDGRRWSTAEYQCVRGLLHGEHGGLAWDTDHRNGEGVNLPQAKPVSKIAGLTVRESMEWMKDYIDRRYAGPFGTPRPCKAGY